MKSIIFFTLLLSFTLSQTAGIWPDKFHARILATGIFDFANTTAPSRVLTSFYYDYSAAEQAYFYYDIDDQSLQNPTFAEIWDQKDGYIYSVDYPSKTCSGLKFDLGPLRRNWLQDATKVLDTFVPSSLFHYYQKATLFTKQAPLGLTQSYVVFNSSIAQPVNLGGPASLSTSNSWSILEFNTFTPLQQVPAGIFTLPPYCKKSIESHRGSSLHVLSSQLYY